MPPKWYVVFVGKKRGIFTSWDDCSKQVIKYPGAKHKSFKTKELAESAFIDFNKKHPNLSVDTSNDQMSDCNNIVNEVIQNDNEPSNVQFHSIVKSYQNDNDCLIFGLKHQTGPFGTGLYRSDTMEKVINGEESFELYLKGLNYLRVNHLIEIGYRIIIPQTFPYSFDLFQLKTNTKEQHVFVTTPNL
ncbi:Ribonuclease H [Entamoeba marina]